MNGFIEPVLAVARGCVGLQNVPKDILTSFMGFLAFKDIANILCADRRLSRLATKFLNDLRWVNFQSAQLQIVSCDRDAFHVCVFCEDFSV